MSIGDPPYLSRSFILEKKRRKLEKSYLERSYAPRNVCNRFRHFEILFYIPKNTSKVHLSSELAALEVEVTDFDEFRLKSLLFQQQWIHWFPLEFQCNFMKFHPWPSMQPISELIDKRSWLGKRLLEYSNWDQRYMLRMFPGPWERSRYDFSSLRLFFSKMKLRLRYRGPPIDILWLVI